MFKAFEMTSLFTPFSDAPAKACSILNFESVKFQIMILQLNLSI